jgi:O-antigen ligase
MNIENKSAQIENSALSTQTSQLLKWGIFIAIAILLYIPFIVSESLFFPFVTGKAYAFRIVTEIMFGLYLILAIISPQYRPRKSWILYTFGAFLISIFFSNLFGVNQVASFWSNFERMEGYVTLLHLFALFIVMSNVMTERKHWIWLFNGSVLASLFMVFGAFNQVFDQGFNFRVDTTLGNSTYVGIYMLMNAFLSLYLLFKNKTLLGEESRVEIGFENWRTWFYGISFILQTVILFQTGTRGSMLGILGGLILMTFLMMYFNRKSESAKKVRKIAGILFIAITIFISSVFIFKDTSFVQDNVALKRITSISLSEKTAQARITNWKIATEGFKERPLLGWGQSNFTYVFDKHYLPEHHGNEVWFDRVHNIIFDWLIAGGILGLLLYLSIWITIVWKIFARDKDQKNYFTGNEKSILIAMLAGYFFHNLFVFDQVVSYIYFIFILAFVQSQVGKDIEIFKKTVSVKFASTISIIILIAIPVSVYGINYQNYQANKDMMSAMRFFKNDGNGQVSFYYPQGIYENIVLFQKALDRNTFANREIAERILVSNNNIVRVQNLEDKVKNDYVVFARDKMEELITQFPENSRYPYMIGTFYAQIGQFELSEQKILRAIELSPNKQAIRIPLISIYRNTGQKEKALNLAKETYDMDVSKDDLWAEYAKTAATFDNELFQTLINVELESGNWKRVEGMIKNNIKNNPARYENYISLSAFYLKIGMTEESVVVLKEIIEKFPELTSQVNQLLTEIEAGNNPLGQQF